MFVKRAGDVIPDIDRADFNKRKKQRKLINLNTALVVIVF